MLKRLYYKIFKRYRRLALKLCDYQTADKLIRESVGKPESERWQIAIPEEDRNHDLGMVYLERRERIVYPQSLPFVTCAQCYQPIDPESDVFVLLGCMVHNTVSCVWGFTKKRHTRFRNIKAVPFKKAIKMIK